MTLYKLHKEKKKEMNKVLNFQPLFLYKIKKMLQPQITICHWQKLQNKTQERQLVPIPKVQAFGEAKGRGQELLLFGFKHNVAEV